MFHSTHKGNTNRASNASNTTNSSASGSSGVVSGGVSGGAGADMTDMMTPANVGANVGAVSMEQMASSPASLASKFRGFKTLIGSMTRKRDKKWGNSKVGL